jgi:hypothetical protein
MALTVFAEKMGFFHKGCAGIGIAPLDVCLSPPPGPVPIPYTNVLFAKDLIKGSKTVRIDGEPTFLEDDSETSTSIGDEGGTLGGSVITGVILGKGYFLVWSMTVQIEGLGVCRHGDMMGQNSASHPYSSTDAGSICQPASVEAAVPGPVASRRAAEVTVLEATGPGDSEPAKVIPCAFDKVTVQCSHTGSGDKKRGFGPFEFSYDGGIQDNLPKPEGGGNKGPIEVIAGDGDDTADTISIEISGGPGYGCSKSHPRIVVTDLATGEALVASKGQTKAEFKAKSRKAKMPTWAYMDPTAIFNYFWFPAKTVGRYRIKIDSCGVEADKSPGFASLSRVVEAHTSDTYKFSISIPEVLNREYKAGSTASLEPNAKWEEPKPEERGWDGGMRDGSDWFGKPESEGAPPPVNLPVKKIATSVSFERNGENLKGATDKLEDIIKQVKNVQNFTQSVMNFIDDWQPQVGWKFGFKVAFFSGSLSFEWGPKEGPDHRVFRWWKFDAALTLVEVELTVDFGFKFRVRGCGVTAVLFGKVAGKLELNDSIEATPKSPTWNPPKLALEISGELGIKASLGADWLASGEGKIALGFPFEAQPRIEKEEGLKIDWKFEFSGLEAHVIGRVLFGGHFSRKFELIKPRPIGSGTFPGGKKRETGIPSPQGAIK